MVDEPDNLVLQLLHDMRREHIATREAVVTCMNAMHRIYGHMERFEDRIAAIHTDMADFRADMATFRAEMATFRDETRKNFTRLEGDLLHLENQNISRHGETLNLMRRVNAIDRA